MIEENNLATIPVGPLGIVSMKSCEELGKRVDAYISSWRNERENEHKHTIAFAGYQKDSYLIDAKISRFGSGEAKGSINESVRGKDLYIMTDVTNYNLTYSLCGLTNHMSPDDHFQDLIRIIAAAAGKGKRITVIMPFLYESRQHKRTGRESLDCAVALQELVNLGVENIITFDAHDPRVQNAIPFKGFETVQPAYQAPAAYAAPAAAPVQPVAQAAPAAQPAPYPVERDESSFGYGVLSFLLPLVGLILYLVWHDTTPLKAKSCGIGAIIGFITGVVLTVVFIALYVLLIMALLN